MLSMFTRINCLLSSMHVSFELILITGNKGYVYGLNCMAVHLVSKKLVLLSFNECQHYYLPERGS